MTFVLRNFHCSLCANYNTVEISTLLLPCEQIVFLGDKLVCLSQNDIGTLLGKWCYVRYKYMYFIMW